MNNRLEIIQEIIRTHKVRSQEELASLLASRGTKVAQATLSRDLKKLQVVKQPDLEGGSCYVLPPSGQSQATASYDRQAAASILSIEFSGQMGVVTTLPGCAGMVGAVVDAHSHPGLMGTLAGDDILLLILRAGAPHEGVLSSLESIIPGLSAKLIDKG